MKKIIMLSLFFPFLAHVMENGLNIHKQLDITHILQDKHTNPTEKMDSVHEKLALYLQEKKRSDCNMPFCNELASTLNDAACELLQLKNGVDLRDYRSDGAKYKQSVIMKVANKEDEI